MKRRAIIGLVVVLVGIIVLAVMHLGRSGDAQVDVHSLIPTRQSPSAYAPPGEGAAESAVDVQPGTSVALDK